MRVSTPGRRSSRGGLMPGLGRPRPGADLGTGSRNGVTKLLRSKGHERTTDGGPELERPPGPDPRPLWREGRGPIRPIVEDPGNTRHATSTAMVAMALGGAGGARPGGPGAGRGADRGGAPADRARRAGRPVQGRRVGAGEGPAQGGLRAVR